MASSFRGDDVMQDVYRQADDSGTGALVVGERSQVFPRAEGLMIHAGATWKCASAIAQEAIVRTFQRVSLPKRAQRITDLDFWSHFKWCRKWITWHDQFLLKLRGDVIQLHLSSQRWTLISSHQPRSFVLSMVKNHQVGADVDELPVPTDLLYDAATGTIRSIFTRVYVYDLTYQGKGDPLELLTEQFAMDEHAVQMLTTVYAHIVSSSASGYRHKHDAVVTIKLRLIVRTGPTDAFLDEMFVDGEPPYTWYQMQQYASASKSSDDRDEDSPADDDPRHEPNLEKFRDLSDSFRAEELIIASVAQAAGLTGIAAQPAYRSVSEIDYRQIDESSTAVTLVSNCYQVGRRAEAGPSTGSRRASTRANGEPLSEHFYVFCDDDREMQQQPFHCYAGQLTQNIPVIVSSNRNGQLDSEMRDCGMAPVIMQSARCLC